jgi:hypothetical protein
MEGVNKKWEKFIMMMMMMIIIIIIMSMEWDHISELQPPTDVLFITHVS